MIGETVAHPDYGSGTVVSSFRGGREWLVQFDSGLRFRRPRDEFLGQSTAVPQPTAYYRPAKPMPQEQFKARQLIEALRFGIAPSHDARALTIGLEREQQHIQAALEQCTAAGGSVTAVIGDYGYGKSHLLELTSQEALAQGFLVATASLDLLELPAHRAFAIYSELVSHLRYPDQEDRGLEPLLERVSRQPELAQQFQTLAPADIDPLSLAVRALSLRVSSRQLRQWRHFLERGKRQYALTKSLPAGAKFPSIYKVGHHARQMAYLLSGLASLAKLAGYGGLAVLIDEAESYSLLTKLQRPKASDFFQAMIYAALQSQQSTIKASDLPQHRFKNYPAAFPETSQSLYFMFAITHSDKRLPLEEWLADEHIVELDPHHNASEIGKFLRQLEDYHAQAYSYSPATRQGQVRRAAAEHLALASQQNQLSIRGLVRLSVELYDLLYLNEDYDVVEMLTDLSQMLRTA